MDTTNGNLIWFQFFQVRVTLITIQWMQMMASHNLLWNKSYWLTSFFAHKMACEWSRRIILSWIRTVNCSLTIAVKISSQNIKFVLQMRINKGLLILTKLQNGHNYPHIGHILLIQCKLILVQRLGNLISSIGQRKSPQLPSISMWAAACHIYVCARARTLLHYIYRSWRKCEGNLNFELTDSWPKNLCKKDRQHWECISGMVCEILRVMNSPSMNLAKIWLKFTLQFAPNCF